MSLKLEINSMLNADGLWEKHGEDLCEYRAQKRLIRPHTQQLFRQLKGDKKQCMKLIKDRIMTLTYPRHHLFSSLHLFIYLFICSVSAHRSLCKRKEHLSVLLDTHTTFFMSHLYFLYYFIVIQISAKSFQFFLRLFLFCTAPPPPFFYPNTPNTTIPLTHTNILPFIA